MTPPRPLVSVIVPAFNVERYVAEAVESALAQTYDSVDVFVVDDGSTDGTAAALEPYRGRIRYVEQPNRGLAAARNRGLAESTGALVALLDADDVWLPERLERCVDLLARRPEVGWVTTDAYLLEDGTPTGRRFYGDLVPDEFPEHDQLAAMLRANFVFVGAVVRRELFERHGTFDETTRRAEDYDLWVRFLLGGERVARVPEPLARYRLRADSLSAARAPQWDAHLDVLERHWRDATRRGVRLRATDAHDLARRAAARGRRADAARLLVHAAGDGTLSPGARLRLLAAAPAALAGLRRTRR